MTPKEKAKELVEKFQDIENIGRYSGDYGFSEWSTIESIKQAKQCALIAVDEMIEVCDSYVAPYYYEVKQEIEKL